MTAAAWGQWAAESLRLEALTTPKPGLVDRRNSGAHRDMDLAMLLRSADALEGYFVRCAALGQAGRDRPPAAIFPDLRRAGLAAEEGMFAVTGGVNTHKGAIFSLGLLCAAAGMLGSLIDAETVCLRAGEICRGICARAFEGEGRATKGERAYRQYRLSGARGEAEAGFPSVRAVLPRMRAGIDAGRAPEAVRVEVLLDLMTRVADTNILGRAGMEAAVWVREESARLLARAPLDTPDGRARLEAFDDAMIARWLSPGGAADLLAASNFLAEAPGGKLPLPICCALHVLG